MATSKSVTVRDIAFKRFYRIHADLTSEGHSGNAALDRAVKTFAHESIATRHSYLGRMDRVIVYSCLRPVDRVRSFSESVLCFLLRTHCFLFLGRQAILHRAAYEMLFDGTDKFQRILNPGYYEIAFSIIWHHYVLGIFFFSLATVSLLRLGRMGRTNHSPRSPDAA
jgi:hypothetical protein